MSMIQHTDYTWKTIEYAIATLNVPIIDLANKLGMTTERYENKGLGMATAFLCELSDGLIVGIEELDHLIETKPEPETFIYVESYELRTQSADTLTKRCIDELGLTLANVNWQAEQTAIDKFLVTHSKYTQLG